MEIKSHVDFDDTSIAFKYKTTSELRKSFFLFAIVNNKFLASIATGLVKIALSLRLPVKWIIKKTVFDHFCGGETISDSETTINELSKYNVKTILDYSVEGEDSDEDFDHVTEEVIKTMKKAKDHPDLAFSVFKPTGIAPFALLEKIHAKKSLTEEEIDAFKRVEERFDRICRFGFENDVPVLVDAEDSFIQNPIDQLVYKMMERYNMAKAIVYNTYQMYRKDMLGNLRAAFQKAVTHQYFLGAKLVRGAYMEKERERAEEMGYEDPINPDKETTDNAYNSALKYCLDNKQRVFLFNGSHNEYSNYYLTILMDKHGLKKNDIRVFFGQLYGMGDHISFNLSEKGYNVAKYVPYGPVRSVMPYLFRRAEENTSVKGQSSREFTLIRKELKRRNAKK